MTAGDKQAWERVGRLLERRRVEIDPAYSNFSLFCRERGLDYRVTWSLEHGERDNYRRSTLTSAEVAYALEPGSIRDAVAGGELRPSPAPAARPQQPPPVPADAPDLVADNWHLEEVRVVWGTSLPVGTRLGMIAGYVGAATPGERPRGRQSRT